MADQEKNQEEKIEKTPDGKSEFYFDVQEIKQEKSILIRIHARGAPDKPKPQILQDLLTLFWADKKISSLGKKFPQYSNTLKILQTVLKQGKVDKEKTAGFFYDNIYGYSVHTVLELFET